MALSPITSKAKERKVLTYDLEWNPSDHKLRLFGVYDGSRYRYYTSVSAFLASELTDSNKGRIFYAHAGGSYDVQFILDEIVKSPSLSDYEVEACFSGSAAVLVTIKKGRAKWTFADSFFLLRDSLANIGKWIGVQKLDNQVIFDESASAFNELVTYNERDCVVLYQAIEALQTQLLRLGGQLQATLAACAMALFRRVHLKHTIETSAALNLLFAEAYFASRVEVYRREAKEANYYDVNSSFPFSMSKPQPGSLLGMSSNIPTSPGKLYIAKCDVEVRADCYLPPLPYRSPDSRILFPTGRWSGMFDCEDIELLLETGLGSISNIEQVWYFEPFNELADYVAVLYELKRDADKRLNEGDASATFARQVYKLLLNALYGKFGERTIKRKILINPADTHCNHSPRHADDSCVRMIIPGVWEMSEEVDIVHAHLPISIHTTASSRAVLYRPMSECSEIYYCDTDSISCAPSDTLDTPHDRRCSSPSCAGCLLGGMKLEKQIEDCEWLAPKLYSYKDKGSGKRHVKSKGFSRLSYEQFVDLKEGRDIKYERMARIRETMRFGDMKPRDIKISKRLIGASPKRCPLRGGQDTRPWSVEELCA